MAVATRPCGEFRCVRNSACWWRTSQHGWTLTAACDFIKTLICTIALSLTLFNSVRLPKEAFKYGPVPYVVLYTFWLLIIGLPTTLLQLAMGQLSQQDPVGVWRAVPILRGIGHLKMITTYICCVYYMIYVTLSLAYLIWITKGTFPLRDCTRLHITPNGYENKMNASECFNTTFLAPFTEYPQYLGIMAILIFVVWFFVPILLYRLRKTLKVSLNILAPVVVVIAILLFTFLAESSVLGSLFESCEQWMPLTEPYIWHSALIQALLSTQIAGGYLVSAGGTIYRHSDVRWVSTSIIMSSIFAGWLWLLLWESIGGNGERDTSFISILVIIYQSSMSEKRAKEWPLLAFGIVFLSGIITMITLLFPVYDKLHRLTGDNWRLFAGASSAVGTALTVAVLARGLTIATILDDLIIPVLTSFTTALEVAGFIFIYGCCNLTIDVEFLTGIKLPCFWISTWWTTPMLIVGFTVWWLRALIRATLGHNEIFWPSLYWPLIGVSIIIVVVMVITACIAVVKEEQYNLFSKILSAFKPSRLWGPEEPLARYVWMSQRYANETLSSQNDMNSEQHNYPSIVFKRDTDNKTNNEWLKSDPYQRNLSYSTKSDFTNENNKVYNDIASIYTTHSIPRSKKVSVEEKFRSPNICIAKNEMGGPINCNCNRHFTLSVPTLKNNDVVTSL